MEGTGRATRINASALARRPELRKYETLATIKSVSQPAKPIKVSGFISSEHHQQLTKLAEDKKTTIGVLVATGVRLLLKSPTRHLRGLPMDGRRA